MVNVRALEREEREGGEDWVGSRGLVERTVAGAASESSMSAAARKRRRSRRMLRRG